MEKNTKTVQDLVENRRLAKLRHLHDCLNEVIKVSEATLRKIESEGLNGYYSCNHDVEKWSERVHRAAHELWLLRDISELLSQESSCDITSEPASVETNRKKSKKKRKSKKEKDD